jgi:hypothetical protein
MSEVYPSDNELLNITAEEQTGVEYIATGTAPYYLQFRKLLYRLLLATRRGNDLRVYDEGGLNIGVKSGKFWDGDTLVSYAGSSMNTLADDKAHIYVYLDSSGTLVTDEYSSWPSMSSGAHVRLADITTEAGDITSIVDARDHHSTAVPGGGSGSASGVTVESHTVDDTLTEAQSGSIHTNLGATGTITLTLPASASAGTKFTFCVQANQQLRIDPGAAAIRDDSGYTADKYKWADATGEAITLVADENGDWATTAKVGVWSEEI